MLCGGGTLEGISTTSAWQRFSVVGRKTVFTVLRSGKTPHCRPSAGTVNLLFGDS
jgi:hypothetical protein